MGCLDQLNADKFEGLTCRYPLARERGKVLYWTIEHHKRVSRGGYEVIFHGKRRVFHELENAVYFYNFGKENKIKDAE